MAVKGPTLEQLHRIAHTYNLNTTEEDLESFRGLMGGVLESYARLVQLSEPNLPVKYPRTPGYRPEPEDNPLGAWYWRSEIHGAESGPLAGKTVAIKDNVCVAGVPMMNGTSVLEGYVPDVDATIVTRILDAGGTILGKAVCESLCFSGGSHTSDTGPVYNPHKPGHTAGGSSSGECRPRRCRRGGYGHRRRSGRLDPHPGQLVRSLRIEAYLRPRALHRRVPHRVDAGPYRTDGSIGGRRCAVA